MIKKLALALLLSTFASTVFAIEEFKVDNIRVIGLKRVALGAALTHIPFNVGDIVNDYRISQSIKSLYRSGHFNNIKILRDGNTIIYKIQERETISEIEFDGNKDLKDEQLVESLDGSDIRIGETLDKTVIAGLELGLEDFYHGVGKYNADVKAEITYLPRNRVKVKLIFNEGDAAAIEQINLVGNEIFSDEELLSKIELTYDSPWWDFLAQDRYQKQTLQGDLETIESYYLDRGYLRYKADSTQVSMTPNKEGVYITLNITEGDIYKINEVDFMGDMGAFEQPLKAMNPIRANQTYNGALVTYTEESISRFLGRYGYAYPKVNIIPKINDEDKTVKLTVSVDPGKRIYVNRINLSGNEVTSEEVLRREIRQMEGSWLSNNLVEASKIRLQRLPYLEKVEFETKQIPEHQDIVDVDFTVIEQASGSFNAGVGYGDSTGVSLNAGIQQNNFLGTGNRLGFNINTVSYSRSASLSYTDPYFTIDGVSLGGNASYTEFDAGNANLVQYNNKSYGIGLTLGFPINEYVRVNFGAGYRHNGITKLQTYEQIQQFYDVYADQENPESGLDFDSFYLSTGISRSTLNRGTFPTSGSQQSLNFKITTPNSDVNYFKVDIDTKWYFPLSRNERWSFLTRLEFGYGNGYGSVNGNDQQLPFWENFRAGGSDTLRGFENNSVGPRAIFRVPQVISGSPDVNSVNRAALGPNHDTVNVSTRSVGGNAKLIGGVELIFPIPFVDESIDSSMRTSLFVDVGNVWDTEFDIDDYRELDEDQFNLVDDYSDVGRYRSSGGLSVQWLSPMGPMLFSFAKAIKREEGDDNSFFSFNIGQTF
jgi:outer membrane protein insertion porin family